MIISRTPFRVSFVGGGTDLRSYYSQEPGKVLSVAINKYIYVVVKRQAGIVEKKYRINWSKVEFCDHIDEIEHPIVREALRLLEIDYPLEITTFSDIPAGTGLGSSSAFAVGLLHALFALKGEMVTKYDLASLAAQIEVDILQRPIGKQDHFASSYGNINVFNFMPDEQVIVEPVFYSSDAWHDLQDRLTLFYTKVKRDAAEVLSLQSQQTDNKRPTLRAMADLVEPMKEVLSQGENLNKFGELLHQNWVLKRTITTEISNSFIDEMYNRALQAGALGGKLLGAGGGGFLLLFADPSKLHDIKEELSEYTSINIGFDQGGTRITYYDQTILS